VNCRSRTDYRLNALNIAQGTINNIKEWTGRIYETTHAIKSQFLATLLIHPFAITTLLLINYQLAAKDSTS